MFAEFTWEETSKTIVDSLPNLGWAIGKGLAVFLLFWLAAIILRRVAMRLATIRGIEHGFTRFIGRTVRIITIAFGTVTALGTMGIDIAALVAGLGLTGFALGFALKDIVSNVLAGVLINVYKPFKQGDLVKVSAISSACSPVSG